jgi:hypothetical protein
MFTTMLRRHVLHRVTFNPDQAHFTSSLLITSLNSIMERRRRKRGNLSGWEMGPE